MRRILVTGDHSYRSEGVAVEQLTEDAPAIVHRVERDSTIARVWLFAVFVAALVYILIGRAFTWLAPPLSEARLFAYIGNAWLHGDLPYKAVWEMKPPGIFAVDAAVFAFFPYSFHALAVVEGVVLAGCAATLYLLLREWRVSRTGCSLGVLLFAIMANRMQGASNLTENYLFWPAALSMLVFSRALPELRPTRVVLSGLLTGAATLFKLTGLAPLLAQSMFLVILCFVFRQLTFRKLVATISLALGGVVLAWLPVLVYFGVHDALRGLIEASFVYPFYYSAGNPRTVRRYAEMIFSFLGDLHPIIIFVVIGVGAYVGKVISSFRDAKQHDRHSDHVGLLYLLGGLWVLADLAGALAGNRGQSQYFLPLTLSLAAMAGLTYARHIENQPLRKPVQYSVLALLVGPLMFAHFNMQMREFVHLIRYGHPFSEDAIFGHDRPINAQVQEVAAFVDRNRGANDTLFSWGYHPWLFQMLDIKSPVYVLDLWNRKQFAGSTQRQFVNDVLTQLQSTPPTFIVDSSSVDDPEADKRGNPYYQALTHLMDGQYDFLREFRLTEGTKIEIYRRRP